MKFLRLSIFMAHSMHIINMYPNKKILEKYLQPFSRYSTKEKPEAPKCQMLAANILKPRSPLHMNKTVEWNVKLKFQYDIRFQNGRCS